MTCHATKIQTLKVFTSIVTVFFFRFTCLLLLCRIHSCTTNNISPSHYKRSILLQLYSADGLKEKRRLPSYIVERYKCLSVCYEEKQFSLRGKQCYGDNHMSDAQAKFCGGEQFCLTNNFTLIFIPRMPKKGP